MKRLYFIRHGLSQANVDKLWSGIYDSELTDEGRHQAAAAGEALKNQGIHIDLIIASPLLRTQETARIVAERIGYPLEQILTEKLLIERAFGTLEGTPYENYFNTNVYMDLDSVEGVETIAQMHDRAHEALAALKARPEENILLVSHGSFGRAIRPAAENLPHTHEYNPQWQKSVIENAQIVKLL